MIKYIIVFFVFLSTQNLFAQNFFEQVKGRDWVLVTDMKVNKGRDLEFAEFDTRLLSINNMIWTFLPNGEFTYDYQSSADAEACAGVDFLDIDLDESSWQYNPNTNVLMLTLKGGYASIDDFVVRMTYTFEGLSDGNMGQKFTLKYQKTLFYNDLTRFNKRK